MSISIDTINQGLDTFLNPKLHQVIGTTPESLRENLEQTNLAGRKESGVKFIAVSIFSAAVNKKVASEFFAEGAFKDMRDALGDRMLLNGTINMTSLTLAGHCFLTNDRIAITKFAKELRSKMGASDIWGVGETGGNLSEVQRKIYRQKAGKTTKAAAEAFCNWFLQFTGIVQSGRAPTGGVPLSTSGQVASAAAAPGSTVGTSQEPATREPTTEELRAFTWELPEEDGLQDFYYENLGRTRVDLWKQYTEVGPERTVARVKRAMRNANQAGSVAGA